MMKSKNQVLPVIGKTTKKCKGISFGMIVAVTGSVAASLLPPLILAKIIDRLTLGRSVPFSFVIGYFALIALTGILESARESLLIVFGQKITHALRSSLCEKLTRLSADSLNHQEPGAVVSRFVGDVNTVETLFTSGIISMFADICKIISILVMIRIQNPGLALLLLFLLPVIFWFTRIVQKKMLTAQIANRIAVSQVTNHVPESIRCIRTIHTLGKEEYMEQRYEEAINQSYDAMEKTNFYDAIYSPVILILNAVIVAGVMLLSASGNPQILSLFGMSVGTAVAVMNYISQIFSPLESLGMEIQTIQSAVAGVKRINEFLGQEERRQKQPSEPDCGDPPCIEFRKVTFGYENQPILNHFSFCVKQQEHLTLTGRTGAGKSTIFKLLLGLYEPSEGEVLIEGQRASEIPDAKRRSRIGYVEQSFHLVPGTVKDQITLYDEKITQEMVVEAARMAGLHDTICSLKQGYDTICVPELFSQGQWQLLSIARAVAARPGILLLDEITANLDAETEQMVLQTLKKASCGRTVLSISHRICQQSEERVLHIE